MLLRYARLHTNSGEPRPHIGGYYALLAVAVLDIKAVKVAAQIKTGGQVPKRSATMIVTQ